VSITNFEKLIELEKQIAARLEDDVNITFSRPTCLEIMEKSVSKGKAVLEILQHEE
jgi:hydroxymethylpyrimidine pyrophosphatase-like HAD family hydrolase